MSRSRARGTLWCWRSIALFFRRCTIDWQLSRNSNISAATKAKRVASRLMRWPRTRKHVLKPCARRPQNNRRVRVPALCLRSIGARHARGTLARGRPISSANKIPVVTRSYPSRRPNPSHRRAAPPSRSLADNAATLYGSWWHTLFQHFPWTSGASQWQTALHRPAIEFARS